MESRSRYGISNDRDKRVTETAAYFASDYFKQKYCKKYPKYASVHKKYNKYHKAIFHFPCAVFAPFNYTQ